MRRSQHRFLFPPLIIAINTIAILPLIFGIPTHSGDLPFRRLSAGYAIPFGLIGYTVGWGLKQVIGKVPLPVGEDYAKIAMWMERVLLFVSGVLEELLRLVIVVVMLKIIGKEQAGWESFYLMGCSWGAIECVVAYHKLRPIAPPWASHPPPGSSHSCRNASTSSSSNGTFTAITSSPPHVIIVPSSNPPSTSPGSSISPSRPARRPGLLGKRNRSTDAVSNFFGSFYRTSPPRAVPGKGAILDEETGQLDLDSDSGSDFSVETQTPLLSSSIPYDEAPQPPQLHSRNASIVNPSDFRTRLQRTNNRPHLPPHAHTDFPAPPSFSSKIATHHHDDHDTTRDSDSDIVSVHESDFPPLLHTPATETTPLIPTTVAFTSNICQPGTATSNPNYYSYSSSYTNSYFPTTVPPPPSLPTGIPLPPRELPQDPRRVFGLPVNGLNIWLVALWRMGSVMRHVGHGIWYAGVVGVATANVGDGDEGARWWKWCTGPLAAVLVIGVLCVTRGMNTVMWYTGAASRRGIWKSTVGLLLMGSAIWVAALGGWGQFRPW